MPSPQAKMKLYWKSLKIWQPNTAIPENLLLPTKRILLNMACYSIDNSGAVKVGLHTCQDWINVSQMKFQLCTTSRFQVIRIPTTDWPIARMATSVTAPKISSWTTERYGLMVANSWNQMNFVSTELRKKIIQHLLGILWPVIASLIPALRPDASASVVHPTWPWSWNIITIYLQFQNVNRILKN